MFIEDLTLLPPGSPSPYSFPVSVKKGERWGYGLLDDGLVLCAVGWLGDFVPNEGKTPSECVSRLWDAYKSETVVSDGTAGWHNCELCHEEKDWYPGGQVGPIIKWRGRKQRVKGHGHFLIRTGEIVFLSPVLILHYILDHAYKPPEDFIEAVKQGEFLAPGDLIWVEDLPI